jgi:hypothetical protein
MHPANLYILCFLAAVVAIDLLRRVPWNQRFAAWFIWQGSPVQLGITYTFTHGWPEGEDGDFPNGIPHHHAIDVGILLVCVRYHWFGRVPETSRLLETAPGGPGITHPTPSTHGEEGKEEGRAQEAHGPESGPTQAGQAEGGPAQGRQEGPTQAGT